jgi:hypothetical protein
MYLPRSLYESLPYAYVSAGLLACVGSYLGSSSAWSNVAFIGGAVAIVGGFVLILRRRSYRDDASHYDSHSLDE